MEYQCRHKSGICTATELAYAAQIKYARAAYVAKSVRKAEKTVSGSYICRGRGVSRENHMVPATCNQPEFHQIAGPAKFFYLNNHNIFRTLNQSVN